ncbi:MAG: hypothetical protein JST54_00125 [Deltaproteobacteria bacterium]|nr:hypothetical protein [Deltaproteobacteria bacterium]
MRIVSNPGSNLDEDLANRLKIDLMPQRIVVDGIPHDTRGEIPLSKVDAWIQRSSSHPHVQGTTAADFVEFPGGARSSARTTRPSLRFASSRRGRRPRA